MTHTDIPPGCKWFVKNAAGSLNFVCGFDIDGSMIDHLPLDDVDDGATKYKMEPDWRHLASCVARCACTDYANKFLDKANEYEKWIEAARRWAAWAKVETNR